MLALRFYDRRDIRLEDIPKPVPQQGEVLIKVTDAGISQTQINEFVEGPFIINKTPHPLTHKATPLIPCQEYGGIIEEVGEGVDQSLIGKQVAVAPLLTCGECEYCKMGKENLCEKVGYLGLLGADGGFCEYSVVSVENIIPISQKELLTFIEPILVGLHAAKKIESFLNLHNKKVLILGAGAVGISVAAVFRDYFGANVFINDILEARLKRAQKGGFLTVTKEELAKEYDLVIDAAGMDTLVDKPAIVEGASYLKKSAPLLNIGTYFHPVSYIPSTLLVGEHPLLASLMYTKRDLMLLPEVLKKLSVDFSSFITSIDLEYIIEDGYYKAEVEKESFTRIVVRP